MRLRCFAPCLIVLTVLAGCAAAPSAVRPAGSRPAAVLEIDATPWLAGTPDPVIRETAFARYAPSGKLGPDAATRMIGALLAQGYYVDDGRNVPLESMLSRARR